MSTIARWNTLADGLVDWALSAAVTSAVLLVVVALVWLAIRRRASAHLGHLLFLLPLVPLVLPDLASVELPAWVVPGEASAPPVDSDVAALPPAPQAASLDFPVLEFEEHGGAGLASSSAPAVSRAVAPTWKAWAVLLWAVTVTGLVARLVTVQRWTDRLLRSAPELGGREGDRVRARLERLGPRFGLRRALRVVETDLVPTPAVWGLRRPLLAFDRGLAASLDPEQLDWVLSHELAHLARRDLVRSAAQRLVQVLWFFHPVVWLAARAADELREAACDEAALAVANPSRRHVCAKALVEVAARSVPGERRTLLLTLQEDKVQMKKRIMRMLDTTSVPIRRSSFTGLALCSVLVGSSLVEVTFAQDEPVVEIEEIEEIFEEPGAFTKEDVQLAVDRSLSWLLAQQASDGHWPTGPETEADTGEFNSIGVTGLVLLALDDAQRLEEQPARAQAIDRGRAFLASVQRNDGLFGEEEGFAFMQSHAVATRAWLQTRPDRDEDAWRPAAERAVAVILRARTPYMGWRFDLVSVGDCDTFTTGLMLAALHAARKAGVHVPEPAWLEPLEYIDQVTEATNGRTGYDRKGGNDPRLALKRADYPAELTQLSTAVALTTRMAWGEEPRSSEVIRRGAFLLTEFAPRWDEEAGSIDYYYWLFGTRALAPIGGTVYQQWRDAVVAALVPNQRQDRTGGWWPATDAWGTEGTRVHSTVVCTRALQSVL